MVAVCAAEQVPARAHRSVKKSKIKLALLQKTGIVTGLLLHVSP